MTKFYRVRDKQTGHQFTTAVLRPNLEVLPDKQAVSRNGKALPAKPNIGPSPQSRKRNGKKENA